jgi:Sec-independent protein translocase protein TatA
MPSIGFFELVVIAVVAVLALKPEQLRQAIKTFRRSLLKIRQYTGSLEREILAEEQQAALQARIKAASKVSDVSDLLPESSDDTPKQP